MPECVEVFWTAQWLNNKLKGKILTGLNIISGRYSHKSVTGIELFNRLKGYELKIESIQSKGKVMWMDLQTESNDQLYMFNRFGLTGEWSLKKNEHARIELVLGNRSIYFSDMRNFGTIEFLNRNALRSSLDRLGDDLLQVEFNVPILKTRLGNWLLNSKGEIVPSRGKKVIVGVMLDQTILGSGIGNYLSAEILYDAKISPYTETSTIYRDNVLLQKLAKSIKYIIKLAFKSKIGGYITDPSLKRFVSKNVSKYTFHSDIKIKDGEYFYFKVYKQKKDPFGYTVKASKIITGRTTYWSPSVQK